jgi:hypothetical protein
MSRRSPIADSNFLVEKTPALTKNDNKLFAYFAVNVKILPPRILNPQLISIGDVTAIREGCHINAFRDSSFLLDYVPARYRNDFDPENYKYESRIEIGHENEIGRFRQRPWQESAKFAVRRP